MVLPAGTTLPPLLHGAVVLAAVLAVVGGLWRADPPVTGRTVVALAPWMATGAALYVLAELDGAPAAVAPALTSPTVYLTTAAVAGTVWLAALSLDAPVPATVGTAGAVAFAVPAALATRLGLAAGRTRPLPAAVGLLSALVVAGAAWWLLRRRRPAAVEAVGAAGALVVLGHALDGVSTAVGYDWLGFGERTPLSRIILDVGAALPTAPLLGAGWLFVAVKVTLAAVVAVALANYVRERPREGRLVLAFVAAVGLGPGTHNLVLFAVAGG